MTFATFVVTTQSAIGGTDCAVPSAGHLTIQDAVDDLTCDSITLGSQEYGGSVLIGRSLQIVGHGSSATTLVGRLWVQGGGVVLQLTGLKLRNGCPDASAGVSAGASLQSTDVAVERSGSTCLTGPVLIFGDGFESGSTAGWGAGRSSTEPQVASAASQKDGDTRGTQFARIGPGTQ